MNYKLKILNFKYNNFPIQLGNLIHYSPKQWHSFTHTAISLFEDKEGVFVIEAANNGIIGSYYSKQWLDDRYEVGEIAIGTPIYPIDEKKAWEHFKKHEGDPYAWMKLKDIAIYYLTGRTNVESTLDDWICSEYTEDWLRYSSNNKIDLLKELNLQNNDYISPQDFSIVTQIKWDCKPYTANKVYT